jgi:hypothetical protein
VTSWNQALFVLVWFRNREDLTVLGAGFGISRATAYRYHDEAIGVLADQAPDLHETLQRAKDEGLAYVILDGKLFSADRCSEKTTSVKGEQIDRWYSEKAHEHGGNIKALSAPEELSRSNEDLLRHTTGATPPVVYCGPTQPSQQSTPTGLVRKWRGWWRLVTLPRPPPRPPHATRRAAPPPPPHPAVITSAAVTTMPTVSNRS